MATLVLARHGRTTANATGVLAGRSKGVRLAAAVSSPLERCRESTREMLRAQEEPPRVSSERGLLECDYGSWTGRELKTLAKEPLWKTVQAHPSAAEFPDGEAMTQMSARAIGAIRRWDARVQAQHGPDAVWLAVSHGDVIKAILADALGIHLDAFQRIMVDPASLSVVRYTPLRPFVVNMNTSAGDLSHLKPPPKRRGHTGRRRAGSDAAVGGGTGSGADAGSTA